MKNDYLWALIYNDTISKLKTLIEELWVIYALRKP